VKSSRRGDSSGISGRGRTREREPIDAGEPRRGDAKSRFRCGRHGYKHSQAALLAAAGNRASTRLGICSPLRDGAFDCLISSQVIEHVPYDAALFSEMERVLEPGGLLIIGTPDYSTLGWQIIEPHYGALLPGGYRDEHITHYTRENLSASLSNLASFMRRPDMSLAVS